MSIWTTGKLHNIVLSVGCGICRESPGGEYGSLSCFKKCLEGRSAKAQNDELRLHNYDYTRIDPHLDMEDTALNDYEAIPKLQSTFQATLKQNRIFADLLTQTAFLMISALFFVEIAITPLSENFSERFLVNGTIRTRLPQRHLKHLYRNQDFGLMYFIINEKSFKFALSKTFTVRAPVLATRLEILLACQNYKAPISCSGSSILEILEIQERFQRRRGSRKRRISSQ